MIVRYPRESVGLLMATIATGWIFTNALLLQTGPHPAPILFAPWQQNVPLAPPRPRPVPQPASAPAQPAEAPRPVAVADIQRALARRGLYDGAIDGVWGAKTEAAVRAFIQASGAKVAPDANDALLRAIETAPAKRSEAAPRTDAIAALIGVSTRGLPVPNGRVLAVQQALAAFAYGPVAPTGVEDQETRAAVMRFQSSRGLPADGKIDERFLRELAKVTGRTFE
jgi:peptidoglycan hydrolase-like protein with peptidoglycan-binding domain